MKINQLMLMLGMLLAAGVFADDQQVQPLLVENAWVKEAPPVAKVHAAYLKLTNITAEPIDIVGVSAAGYHGSMIHRTVQKDGITGMEHIDTLSIAPQATVVLEPGGMHIMLMKPDRVLKAGDRVVITLEIDGGRSQMFDAIVRAAP